MADLKNFADFLNYYKQTGKLPSGIDQPTMDAANANAEMLGIPAETAQIPFALGQSPEPVAPVIEEAPVIEKTPAQQPSPKPALQATPMPSAAPAAQMAVPQIASAVNPLEDKETQAAQEAARHDKAAAMGLEASRLVSQGLGSLGAGSSVNLDASGSNMLLKNAAAPVEELATAREQQMKKMQLAEEAAKNDPKSPVSQAMREALAGMGVKLPENATYATMEKLAPQIMKSREFQMRLQELAMRRQEAAANKEDREVLKRKESVAKIRDKFLSSERYKGSMEQKTALDSARVNLELAKKGHSQGYTALGANLAKIAGEKGMLSEADVNRYLKEKGIPGRVQSGIFETTGKPTKQQLNNLQAMLTDMSGALNSRMKKMAENEISGYSYGYGVEPAEIEKVLPELKDFKSEQAPTMVHMVDSNGIKEYDVPADKVEQAKKAGWKVK